MSNDSTTQSVRVSAVPKPKVRVGFNYPWAWNKYGLYFGGGSPPGSDPHMDKWIDSLKKNLDTLRACHIDLVRIFLLCNLANFGGSTTRSGVTPLSFDWSYTLPPSLHPNFIKHLTDMLQAFKDAKMQVLPSLVDFGAIVKLFDPTYTLWGRLWGDRKPSGCTNRYEIITDQTKGDAFLNMVLAPFLAASKPYKDQIFAWEVMNEPSWATGNSIRWKYGQRAIPKADLVGFLTRAVAMIDGFVDQGKPVFTSTVGHRFASDLSDFPTGTLRQFHYYPVAGPGDGDLPLHSETKAILGEFAAGIPDPSDLWEPHTLWPEIAAPAQRSGEDIRILLRLNLIQEKGYRVALIWPAPGQPESNDERTPDLLKLSQVYQNGILQYLPDPPKFPPDPPE
jgi:hypothetical protein